MRFRSEVPSLCVVTAVAILAGLVFLMPTSADDVDETLNVRLRSRTADPEIPGGFAIVEKAETWKPSETAIIVCDMWDLHHCLNAVRRGTEMAPTMDRVLKTARDQGSLIIHAPSDCTDSYKDHPARLRAIATPKSKNLPDEIGTWCYKIPSEEQGVYPIDQSDGGEDDDPAEHKAWAEKLAAMGRNPRAPWKTQTDLLTIDADRDYISASGEEVWSILEQKGIKNVVLLGVHLNMCVLGRPFGLRQMARNGRNVVLMRDMTDTMYNPAAAPYVSHFTGTDLMVEHVEKFVCPTITSDQILGGKTFRFKDDKRPTVAMIIADDEYKTEVTLPAFASSNLIKDYRVDYLLAPMGDKHTIGGTRNLEAADALLVSARRRVLPKDQTEAIRAFVASGKPVIGIRTASHAFAPRGDASIATGFEAWPEFDAQVLGGNYHGHHKDGPTVAIKPTSEGQSHPILQGVDASKIVGHGSLYQVSPLAKTAAPLLVGTIPDAQPEPVLWVNTPETRNRVVYTSLGQKDDFANPEFVHLLRNAVDWAMK